MHSAKSMAQRSKKPSRQAAMLEPTVPEGCGKSVDGAALIQVGTKTRNGQSLVERLFRYYLVSQHSTQELLRVSAPLDIFSANLGPLRCHCSVSPSGNLWEKKNQYTHTSLYRLFLSPHSLSVTTVTLGSRLFFILLQINLLTHSKNQYTSIPPFFLSCCKYT
jgi:hypothetical protein